MTFNMYLSDPTNRADKLDQFGQYEIFWEDASVLSSPRLFPTGRLHGAPVYFTLEPTWTYVQPIDAGQRALFVDIFLKREPLQQYIPSGLFVKWLDTTGPFINYKNAHFRSSKFDVDETVYNRMTWYLVYGNMDNLSGPQFLDSFTYGDLDYNLQGYDSKGTPSGNEVDEPAEFFGWAILLVRQVFVAHAPWPLVEYHLYGAWCLPQPNTPEFLQAAGEAVWDPTIASRWYIYHNPLLFPSHYLTLTPWQP